MPVFTVGHCATRVPLNLGDGYVVYFTPTQPPLLRPRLVLDLPADLSIPRTGGPEHDEEHRRLVTSGARTS